jgi:hypothetical protein
MRHPLSRGTFDLCNYEEQSEVALVLETRARKSVQGAVAIQDSMFQCSDIRTFKERETLHKHAT